MLSGYSAPWHWHASGRDESSARHCCCRCREKERVDTPELPLDGAQLALSKRSERVEGGPRTQAGDLGEKLGPGVLRVWVGPGDAWGVPKAAPAPAWRSRPSEPPRTGGPPGPGAGLLRKGELLPNVVSRPFVVGRDSRKMWERTQKMARLEACRSTFSISKGEINADRREIDGRGRPTPR